MNSLINGVAKIFQSSPSTITGAELRGAAIAAAVAGLVVGSKVTRKRVEEGKEPIGGFLF